MKKLFIFTGMFLVSTMVCAIEQSFNIIFTPTAGKQISHLELSQMESGVVKYKNCAVPFTEACNLTMSDGRYILVVEDSLNPYNFMAVYNEPSYLKDITIYDNFAHAIEYHNVVSGADFYLEFESMSGDNYDQKIHIDKVTSQKNDSAQYIASSNTVYVDNWGYVRH